MSRRRPAVQIKVGGTQDGSRYTGGQALSDIGYYGDVVYSHRWPGGSWDASWKMNLPTGTHDPLLHRGNLVQIFEGPTRRWLGEMTEPDWESGEFHAKGIARAAEDTPALSFTTVTSSPGEALFYAGARGEIRFGSLHTFADEAPWRATDPPTDDINTLASLLDAYSDSQGQSWGVDNNGLLFCRADPTTPTWWVTPGAGRLGVADEDYVTRLWFRYTTGPGIYELGVSTDTSADRGNKARAVSLTNLGYLSDAKAQSIGDKMLDKLGARTGWSNGLELAYGQITSLGAERANLGDVQAGTMLRLAGLVDERGGHAYTDIVLAETTRYVARGRLQIVPKGMADRDWASIVEKMGGVLL